VYSHSLWQSKIAIKWTYARDHTGIGESSHFQDNNFWEQLLLAACLKLKLHSQEMFSSSQLAAEEGIYNTFRIAAQMRRKEKRQYKAAERRINHPDLPYNPLNPYDTPVPPAPQMPPAQIPPTQMPVPQMPSAPTAIRRHLRQESAKDIERRQREERILQLQERLEKSL